MSDSIRTEEQRRIAELESLVAGQANEIARLERELDACQAIGTKLYLTLDEATRALKKAGREASKYKKRR